MDAAALTPQMVQALDEVAANLDGKDRDLLRELIASANGPEHLIQMLQDLSTFDYRWKPVNMETFLLHPDYLGLKGQVWPRLVEDLTELFEGDYDEAVLFGSIGWGKSTFAEIAMARMTYEVSCLQNPQAAYGLMEGSLIALITASVNKAQAEKVVFHGLRTKFQNSPYFKQFFPFEKDLKEEMRFPNGIVLLPVAASEGGTVGYNVFGGVLDEVNFWAVTEKSQLARGQRYDQARAVYDMLSRRIKSRFSKQGKLPGILLQVSSSKYPDDFTEQRAKEVLTNGETKTFVRRYSNWDTRPPEHFLPTRFYLYRGTSGDRPRIGKTLAELGEEKDPALINAVPMDFWEDFTADLDGSIRDIAGYPTLSIQPFLPQREKLLEAVERGRAMKLVHPFTVETTTLQDGAVFDARLLKFDSKKRYFAHVDLAVKKDRAGIAVGHIDGYRRVVRKNSKGDEIADVAPLIVIDLMLRVQAPEGGEIQIDYVRGLLLEMRSYGCHFKRITYDQYQSAQSIQAFQRMGIESERLSVDQPLDPYNAFKEAILEDRLAVYDYTPFLEEAVRLELKPGTRADKAKVDHPPKGSKDVTDAVVGVVWHCTQAKQYALVDPSFGELLHKLDGGMGAHWQVGDRSWEPTVDAKGDLLPGKRLRTMDDMLFAPARKFDPGEGEDGEYPIGFA